MLDVDQTLTSGAVRADAGAIEQFTGMYRVHVVDGSKPGGTFQIELFNPSELAIVVFDIVSLPSDPGIRAFASSDGITQVEASAISRSGYRVNAWFPNMPVKYLKIEISPTHPDTIGGNTFTFGLTSFSAEAVDYALFSELMTKPVVFKPQTVQGRFRAVDSGSDVRYYLSMTALRLRNRVAPVPSRTAAAKLSSKLLIIKATLLLDTRFGNLARALFRSGPASSISSGRRLLILRGPRSTTRNRVMSLPQY